LNKKALALIAMCIALLIFAQSALALTVTYSEQYKPIKTAREAIMGKYRLTHAMFGLFGLAEQSETTYTFRPFPNFLDLAAVGAYQVTILDGNVTAVSWTHDGVDENELKKGYLDSPAWGAEQLENVQQIYSMKKMIDYSTEENKAILEAYQSVLEKMMDDARYPEDSFLRTKKPRPEDFDEDLAIQLATKAVIKKYGVDPNTIDGYQVEVFYYRVRNVEDGFYNVNWNQTGTFNYPIQVQVLSPSQNITFIFWMVDEVKRLPEGPLDDYFEAVMEYLQLPMGVLSLSHEERAELQLRIDSMEPQRTFPVQFAAPGGDYISEDEAVKSAMETLAVKYGFTPEFEELFQKTVTFQLFQDSPCWVVVYSPQLQSYLHRSSEKMGEYVVVIPGSGEAAIYAHWSNDFSSKPIIYTPDGIKELQYWTNSVYLPAHSYTESDWGLSPYWDASVLPYVGPLVAWRYALEQKNGLDFSKWSLDDKNAYDQPCRDAGFGSHEYPMGLPGPDSIPEADAAALASLAFSSEYGLSKEDLERFDIRIDFVVGNPDKHVWAFTLFHKDHPIVEDSYYLELDSETGEIVQSWHAATGHG